jgi:hypothetical protein
MSPYFFLVQGARPYIYRGRAPCTKANTFILNALVVPEKHVPLNPRKMQPFAAQMALESVLLNRY